jgi:hypothetical protein
LSCLNATINTPIKVVKITKKISKLLLVKVKENTSSANKERINAKPVPPKAHKRINFCLALGIE